MATDAGATPPNAGSPKKGRKWLRGCAAGCGVALLLGIGAGVVSVYYLAQVFRGIEKANESQEALIAELGGVAAYVPPADGVPAPGRVELFVGVRESTEEARTQVDAALEQLPVELTEEGAVVGRIHVGLQTLGDLIDGVGVYLQARNQALLERRMSAGEYVYLYTLTYTSWLGHAPGESPGIRQGPNGVRVGMFEENDALFGDTAVRRRYRRYTLRMLRGQLASLGRERAAGTPGELRSALEGEIRRMKVDPGRVLWQDGLPPEIAASLEPFRERLEAQYSAATNRMELPLAGHEAPWDWK